MPREYAASLETYSLTAMRTRFFAKSPYGPHPEGMDNYPDISDSAVRVKPEPVYARVDRQTYSGQIYSHEGIKQHAQWVVENLDAFGEFDFVAVTGKSGMSVAFAALMLRDFPVITVRKGESSHGLQIEGVCDRMHRYVVIDDFIATGDTLKRIQQELEDYAKSGWVEANVMPRRIGTLCYTDEIRRPD